MPTITATNVSDGWKQVANLCLKERKHQVAALTVEIDIVPGLDDPLFRSQINELLVRNECGTVDTVSRTIFPDGMWNPSMSRAVLFERYSRILPKLRKCPLNRRGIYFERMIAYPTDRSRTKLVNQLDFIIETWVKKKNHRRSALQAALYNPFLDATHSPRLGFPCLQQVAFIPSNGDLTVMGFYPLHYIFERAYGNYLGLAHLGQFMASEMGLTLKKVICTAGVAELEVPPRKLTTLKLS